MSWELQILLLIKDVLYCIILNMNLKWCRVLEPIKVFYVLLCKWKKKNNQSWKNLSRDLFKFYMCHFLCLQQMKNIWFLHCTYNHHHYIDLVFFLWGKGTVIKFIFLKLFQALIFNFTELKLAWRVIHNERLNLDMYHLHSVWLGQKKLFQFLRSHYKFHTKGHIQELPLQFLK